MNKNIEFMARKYNPRPQILALNMLVSVFFVSNAIYSFVKRSKLSGFVLHAFYIFLEYLIKV